VNCHDVMALLSADMDNELLAEQAHAVRTHLTSCRECARRSELLRDTREAFQSVASEPAAGLRYAAAAMLAAATLAAVVGGVSLLRTPRPAQESLRNGNAADYCGVSGPNACVVEPPLCSGEECTLLLVTRAE